MRVCLDVSPAVHGRAGMGRYALDLGVALAQLLGHDECVVFYNRAAEAQVPPELAGLARLTTNLGDKPWRLSVLLAHALRLPQDGRFRGVDLFHATDHLLPRLAHVRSVFTLHDLTFRSRPETHLTLNRGFLTWMVPRFLRAADAIVADSECTQRDAVRLYGVDAERVRVVYPGVNRRFRPASDEARAAVRQRYGLPARFILYVGTIEPRKNLARLLEAYVSLRCEMAARGGAGDAAREPAPRLVIAGKRGWLAEDFFRRLRELGLGEEVLLPGFVADADLPALYSAAELFVFPSLYEGFGLPALEAMACGAPVVCSNTSSLPEVVGDAALTVAPEDIGALAAAMRRALSDPTLRHEMTARGLERAGRFTWERTASEMLAVYEHVLRKRERGGARP